MAMTSTASSCSQASFLSHHSRCSRPPSSLALPWARCHLFSPGFVSLPKRMLFPTSFGSGSRSRRCDVFHAVSGEGGLGEDVDGGGAGMGGQGYSGGGGGRKEEGDGASEGGEGKKAGGMSMSQKITLAYATLVGVGGLVGYLKGGSQKSLAAGGLSALLLYYVYTQLPVRPAFASSLGLGLSAALLVAMGSRFRKSGKIFPAGVVSLVSFVMVGGYIHGILRGMHHG